MPTIIAHRGLHARHPENSLAAFEAAWESGLEWAECDVHLSADGVPVVIHDRTLERTTAARGAVRQYPWERLRRLVLRGPDGRPTTETIPSLAQLLEMMPVNAALLVEIKPVLQWHEIQSILSLINNRRCIIQSFERANLETVYQCDTRITTAWLVEHADRLVVDGRIAPMPFPALNASYQGLTGPIVDLLHAAGKQVGAWTVNEERDIRRMLGLGVDSIITDQPALVAGLASL